MQHRTTYFGHAITPFQTIEEATAYLEHKKAKDVMILLDQHPELPDNQGWGMMAGFVALSWFENTHKSDIVKLVAEKRLFGLDLREHYVVWNGAKTEGFATDDKQLAYEVRKSAASNCYDAQGVFSLSAATFCEKWAQDDCTIQTLGSELGKLVAEQRAFWHDSHATLTHA
jgi:hypothetical protein